MSVDYATISAEDKYALLTDIFENRQLKQAMEYVDANIIITTIHGAKGLEWQYVFCLTQKGGCFQTTIRVKVVQVSILR